MKTITPYMQNVPSIVIRENKVVAGFTTRNRKEKLLMLVKPEPIPRVSSG